MDKCICNLPSRPHSLFNYSNSISDFGKKHGFLIRLSGRINVFRSFTLVELLVVMGIISMLAALLLPSLRKAIKSAHSIHCIGNIRQVSTGTLIYANDNDGHIVPNLGVNEGLQMMKALCPILDIERSGDGAPLPYYDEPEELLHELHPGAMLFHCPEEDSMKIYRSFGYNRYISRDDNVHAAYGKLSNVVYPTKTFLWQDGYWHTLSYQECHGDPNNKFIPGGRHFGKHNVAWCDGSTGSLLSSEAGSPNYFYCDQ